MSVPPAGAGAGGAGGASGRVPEAALREAPALLERAVAYNRACLGLLPRAAVDAPTPCAGWSLVRLLQHLDDSLAAFTEAAETGYVAPAGPTEPHPAMLATSLRDRSGRLLGAWAHEPGRSHVHVGAGQIDTSLLAATGALEITVHGWDVARACREDRPIPEELATALLAMATLLVGTAPPASFAPPYDVPGTADASVRLLALLGRR